jgi:hypothetical protein
LFRRSTPEVCEMEKALGGFEPPSLDSESRVLTVTPQGPSAALASDQLGFEKWNLGKHFAPRSHYSFAES